MSSNNKLVKTATDALVLTSLVAGMGWLARKVVREDFTDDPSRDIMNFLKFSAVLTASLYAKDYLQDQKVIPT